MSDEDYLLTQMKWVSDLEAKYAVLYDALTEIAMFGTSRPREMGEGDDGDGHYKSIALKLINMAAIARRQVR